MRIRCLFQPSNPTAECIELSLVAAPFRSLLPALLQLVLRAGAPLASANSNSARRHLSKRDWREGHADERRDGQQQEQQPASREGVLPSNSGMHAIRKASRGMLGQMPRQVNFS